MAGESQTGTDGEKSGNIPALAAIGGPTKAAIMLITLGAEACAEIFKRLDEEDVEILTAEIARLDGITPETRERVLEEFHQMAVAQKYILQGGVDYARQALEAAMGPRRAKEIMEKVQSSIRTRELYSERASSDHCASASTYGYRFSCAYPFCASSRIASGCDHAYGHYAECIS
jgi:flagellar motor switch protein FliG